MLMPATSSSSSPEDFQPPDRPSDIPSSNQVFSQSNISFKDKLLGSTISSDQSNNEKDDLNLKSDDVEIVINEEDLCINFSERIKGLLSTKMRNTIVVRLLGSYLGYRELCYKIENLWKPKGGFKVIDMDNHYFAVIFVLNEDYLTTLLNGPWKVRGHYLLVQPWNPLFSTSDNDLASVIAWVRLPALPLHYYNREIILTIENQLGKVIKLDDNTANGQRGKFARMAIEIDLTKPLRSKNFVDGIEQLVIYEGLPTKCSICKKFCYGCTAGTSSNSTLPKEKDTTADLIDTGGGQWRSVRPFQRRRNFRTTNSNPSMVNAMGQTSRSERNQIADGSRFQSLAILDDANREANEETDANSLSKEGNNILPTSRQSTMEGIQQQKEHTHDQISTDTNHIVCMDGPITHFSTEIPIIPLHDKLSKQTDISSIPNVDLPSKAISKAHSTLSSLSTKRKNKGFRSKLDPSRHTVVRFDSQHGVFKGKEAELLDDNGFSLRGLFGKSGVGISKSRRYPSSSVRKRLSLPQFNLNLNMDTNSKEDHLHNENAGDGRID